MKTTFTEQEQRDMLTQAAERAMRDVGEEFVRRTTELYKQTDRYKEHMKRIEAEKDVKIAESQS